MRTFARRMVTLYVASNTVWGVIWAVDAVRQARIRVEHLRVQRRVAFSAAIEAAARK